VRLFGPCLTFARLSLSRSSREPTYEGANCVVYEITQKLKYVFKPWPLQSSSPKLPAHVTIIPKKHTCSQTFSARALTLHRPASLLGMLILIPWRFDNRFAVVQTGLRTRKSLNGLMVASMSGAHLLIKQLDSDTLACNGPACSCGDDFDRSQLLVLFDHRFFLIIVHWPKIGAFPWLMKLLDSPCSVVIIAVFGRHGRMDCWKGYFE
jgi:hypothetical protein